MSSDVFISYSKNDEGTAHQIRQELINHGISCFLDNFEIHPGQNITERVIDGISGSKDFVVIISEFSLESHWVPMEIGLAMAMGKFIIPYSNTATPTMPEYLVGRKYIHGIKKLRDYLEKRRVSIEGLRILRELVGENNGRDLNIYKTSFYTPYINELESVGYIENKDKSYFLTRSGIEFTYRYLEENLNVTISPKDSLSLDEINQRRILLAAFNENPGRDLYKLVSSNYYSPTLQYLVDTGHLNLHNGKYTMSSKGKEKLIYFLTR